MKSKLQPHMVPKRIRIEDGHRFKKGQMIKKISFREVTLEDAELILNWRISSRVTKFMNTDITYDIIAQKKWISSCYNKSDYYHWIILFEGAPIGLINLADFSLNKLITSWGFYVGVDHLNGIGAFIPPFFYNFIFQQLRIDNINVKVFFNNLNVIGLHQLHGYKFDPIHDKVIQKNGKDILLVAMKLNKANWNYNRYMRFAAQFSVSSWICAPKELFS